MYAGIGPTFHPTPERATIQHVAGIALGQTTRMAVSDAQFCEKTELAPEAGWPSQGGRLGLSRLSPCAGQQGESPLMAANPSVIKPGSKFGAVRSWVGGSGFYGVRSKTGHHQPPTASPQTWIPAKC
jgi:hypothetical protein